MASFKKNTSLTSVIAIGSHIKANTKLQKQQRQRQHQQQQQQHRSMFSMVSALICFATLCMLLQTTFAKSLDSSSAINGDVNNGAPHFYEEYNHHHHEHNEHHNHLRRRLQRDSDAKNNANVREHCDAVKGYLESIDIKLNVGTNDDKGAICGGNCCSNSTEIQLRQKATTSFENLLHHHTKSLRDLLKSTAFLFEDHVLELAAQSENKTLSVFSTVYRGMVPLSKKLIHQLYSEIMGHLKMKNFGSPMSSLEDGIHEFFVNLFPIAYHHLSKSDNGELHEDYINCLKHTFDDLQPFGNIPKELKRNLVQSVQTATIFMNSLIQSAEVLNETDQLYGIYLADTCKKHLLKMNYCPSCNGYQKSQVKPCFSYCMNVLRGCSAQYAGVLDSPWSNVVDAIENLLTAHIRTESGIVSTIKMLDVKLSETIMLAMENGPELAKKVKKTCGTPKLLPTTHIANETRPSTQQFVKLTTPLDAAVLNFLSTIDKSKEFYSNIVNNYCENDDIERTDRQCWTGDRIGDYTQSLMTTGIDSQRYNPEVPLKPNSQSIKLNELVDKLIKIRKNIGSAIPSTTRHYSDIQSDMARHDEEGSGRISDDADDEEYSSIHGSGDGSGDGSTPSPFDPTGGPTFVTNNDIEERSTATLATPMCFATLTATTLLVTIKFFNSIALTMYH